MPSDIIGPAALSVGQSVAAFQFFLPKLADVRKTDPMVDPEMVGDVRMGEVAAIAVSIGVGTIISSLTGSPVPAFVAAGMAILLVVVYESTLRSNRPFEPKVERRTSDA